jgi:N-acetylglucosaminyl-diphospho-decaprenol L-rhamnosyltransferase
MASARVVAVVVTRNSASCLPVCLQSLLSSDYGNLKVVVVDNASSDATRSTVTDRFPSVELIALGSNRGFAAANNLALARVAPETDYAFLLNPDTRVGPLLVTSLVDAMDRHPDLGIVGPLQYAYAATGPLCQGPLNEWSRYILDRLGAHEFVDQARDLPRYGPSVADNVGIADVAFVQGSALMVRMAALRSAGMFDERFFCFYEEVDLCRRVRWAGHRVCVHTALGLEHLGGGSTVGASGLRLRLMMRNRYYYTLTDPRFRGSALRRLLARFAREDLGMGRGRRASRASAFVRSVIWLTVRWRPIRARRSLYRGTLAFPQRSSLAEL